MSEPAAEDDFGSGCSHISMAAQCSAGLNTHSKHTEAYLADPLLASDDSPCKDVVAEGDCLSALQKGPLLSSVRRIIPLSTKFRSTPMSVSFVKPVVAHSWSVCTSGMAM